VDRNEETLRVFLEYSYGQGLASRQWTTRELFAPECLLETKI
jgi:hypothetical protein